MVIPEQAPPGSFSAVTRGPILLRAETPMMRPLKGGNGPPHPWEASKTLSVMENQICQFKPLPASPHSSVGNRPAFVGTKASRRFVTCPGSFASSALGGLSGSAA